MSKPRAVQWLEDQTGQSIDVAPEPVGVQERHLSVRLTSDLAAGLDALASERGLTVSQLVRELLNDAVRHRASVAAMDGRALAERLAADVAEVQRRLAADTNRRKPPRYGAYELISPCRIRSEYPSVEECP